MASRIGIRVGENAGISDMIATNGWSGADGSTEIPTTYPMTRNIVAGATAPDRSSCRDTNAPSPANTSEYNVNPSTNHTTSQATNPAVVGTDTVSEDGRASGRETR